MNKNVYLFDSYFFKIVNIKFIATKIKNKYYIF